MELKILEMKKMQAALDAAIEKEHGVKKTFEKMYLALFDELGELNHELKGEWCYWKKTQKPVDREKVLEELVDAWHFALSISNRDRLYTIGDCEGFGEAICHYNLPDLYCMALRIEYPVLSVMYAITMKLDFTIDDVYNEYIRKNKVNYERLANGY